LGIVLKLKRTPVNDCTRLLLTTGVYVRGTGVQPGRSSSSLLLLRVAAQGWERLFCGSEWRNGALVPDGAVEGGTVCSRGKQDRNIAITHNHVSPNN
jgi:hypothetical protein